MTLLSLLAFISLLVFLLGVLTIMSSPDRILDGAEQYGARVINIDAQGNGDYATIQEGINAAYSQTPAADSRWLIRVAPGEYEESLTLYDYIDISGYAPGFSTYLVSPPALPAIANGAECTLSNLRIGGDNDPVIQTYSGFTGTIRFVNITVEETDASLTLFQVTSGSVEIWYSDISFGGRVTYITAGFLLAFHSTLRQYNTDSGGDTYPTIVLDNASAIFEAYNCEILNDAVSGSGGAAVGIYNASATTIIHNSLLRKATGSYSITTSTTPAVYMAACVANAAIHASITGTHDVQVDANY